MGYSFKTLCSNLIPAGEYKAIITDLKYALAGTATQVTLTIAEGPYAKRVHIETINEKAYSFRLMPLLNAAKVDVSREFGTKEELFKFGFANAKGQTIVIEMGTRTYNGQEYNNVVTFKPVAGSTTSFEDVTLSFDEAPQVKGNSLDGMVTEETTSEVRDTKDSDEPVLDIDLDDIEKPF